MKKKEFDNPEFDNEEGKPVRFSSDGLLLSGVLHLPEGEIRAGVIGCHGLFSDKNSPKQVALAERMTQKGIAYLRFDHRGCGESQGNFSQVTDLEGRSRDLDAAARFLLRDVMKKDVPLGLFGSSMGGAVCLNRARSLNAAATVTLAAPIRIESSGQAMRAIENSPSPFPLDSAFYQRNLTFDLGEKVSGISKILILHGEDDPVIPASDAEEIYSLACEPRELLIFPGGDHPLSDPAHQKRFMERAVQWLESHLAGALSSI